MTVAMQSCMGPFARFLQRYCFDTAARTSLACGCIGTRGHVKGTRQRRQVQISLALPAVSFQKQPLFIELCSSLITMLNHTASTQVPVACKNLKITLLGQGLLQAAITVTACPNQTAQLHDVGNPALPNTFCLLLAAQLLWHCS